MVLRLEYDQLCLSYGRPLNQLTFLHGDVGVIRGGLSISVVPGEDRVKETCIDFCVDGFGPVVRYQSSNGGERSASINIIIPCTRILHQTIVHQF